MSKYRNNCIILSIYSCLLAAHVYASQGPASYTPSPSQNNCGAAISKEYLREDNINQALACMEAGFREVYYGSTEQISDIAPELKQFYEKSVNKLEFYADIPQNNLKSLIIYTKRGEKNALMLQKYYLEGSLTSYCANVRAKIDPASIPFLREVLALGGNSHIMGTLLGYAPNDIIFYYQLEAYKRIVSQQFAPTPEERVYKLRDLTDVLFDKWSEADKGAFNRFIKNDQEWQKAYDKDKKIADLWLEENNKLSIEYLTNYGKAFSQPFAFLNNPDAWQLPEGLMQEQVEQRSEVVQESPQVQPAPQILRSQSRWQQLRNTVLTTGIAAGLAALWHKYVSQ